MNIKNFLLFQSTPTADAAAQRKKTDEPAPDDEATTADDAKPVESFVASAEDEEEEEEVQSKPTEPQVQAETVGATRDDCFIRV